MMRIEPSRQHHLITHSLFHQQQQQQQQRTLELFSSSLKLLPATIYHLETKTKFILYTYMMNDSKHSLPHLLCQDWNHLLQHLLPLFMPSSSKNDHQPARHRVNVSSLSSSSNINSNNGFVTFSIRQEAEVQSVRSLSKVALFFHRLILSSSTHQDLVMFLQQQNKHAHQTNNKSSMIQCFLQFEERNTSSSGLFTHHDQDQTHHHIDWNSHEDSEQSLIQKFSLVEKSFRSTSPQLVLSAIGIRYLISFPSSASSPATSLYSFSFDPVVSYASLLLHFLLVTKPSPSRQQVDISVSLSSSSSFDLPFESNKSRIAEDFIRKLIIDYSSHHQQGSSSSSSLNAQQHVAATFEDEDEASREKKKHDSLKIKIKRVSFKNNNKLTLILADKPFARNFITSSLVDTSPPSSKSSNSSLSEKLNSLFYHQILKYWEQYGVVAKEDKDEEETQDNNIVSSVHQYVVGGFFYINHSSSSSSTDYEISSSFERYQLSGTAIFFSLLRQVIGVTSSSKLTRFVDVIEARARHQERMSERCRREKISFDIDEDNNGKSNNGMFTSAATHHQRNNNINNNIKSMMKHEQEIFSNLTKNVSIYNHHHHHSNESNKLQKNNRKKESSSSSSLEHVPLIASSSSTTLPYQKFVVKSNNEATKEDHKQNFINDDDDDDDGYNHNNYQRGDHRIHINFPQFLPADREELQQCIDENNHYHHHQNEASSSSDGFIFQFDRKFLICGIYDDDNNSSTKNLAARNLALLQNNNNNRQSSSSKSLNNNNNRGGFFYPKGHPMYRPHPYLCDALLSESSQRTNNNHHHHHHHHQLIKTSSSKKSIPEENAARHNSHPTRRGLPSKFFIMDQHAVSERGRLEAFRAITGLKNTMKRKVLVANGDDDHKEDENPKRKKNSSSSSEALLIPINNDEPNEEAMSVLIDFKMKNHHQRYSSSSSNLITNRQIAQLAISFSVVLDYWGWKIEQDDNNNNNNYNNNKDKNDQMLRITSIPCFTLETFELLATGTEPLIEFLLQLNLVSSSMTLLSNNNNNSNSSSSHNTFMMMKTTQKKEQLKNNNNNNNNNFLLAPFLFEVVPPILERFAVSRSCRGAVMFHDRLTTQDMQLILKSVVNTSQFDQCSHGRVSMKMMKATTTAMMVNGSFDDDNDNDSAEDIAQQKYRSQMFGGSKQRQKSFIEKSPYATLI